VTVVREILLLPSHFCMARTRGVRLCGTASNYKKASGKILTPSESRKFHDRGEQDLADRVLSMDNEEHEAFDHLREDFPAAPVRVDDEDWEDVFGDAMDIGGVLDGTNPINLSHEGGEFYELVEHCIETTSK
jgi:hypothetical protein